MTMLEATRDGWWYAARLPDGKATAAFATDPEIIKQNNLRTEQGWLWHLSDTLHIAPALQEARFLPGSLLIQPALSLLRQPVAGNCWLAVGDAASVYDPLSAQGVYKALLDGMTAGAALADRIDGEATHFDAYAKAVQDRFESYRANRAYLYGLEQRWADAPFWKRRHEEAHTARRSVPARPENAR
jgi:2-polyprenyl-6-methoxyphenol hydroxylase-like FAD-dependent oxidoreductase